MSSRPLHSNIGPCAAARIGITLAAPRSALAKAKRSEVLIAGPGNVNSYGSCSQLLKIAVLASAITAGMAAAASAHLNNVETVTPAGAGGLAR